MKTIYIPIVVLMLLCSVPAQQKMSDVEFAGLKGRVKSVVDEGEYTLQNDTGQPEVKRVKTEEWQYDSKGALLTYINWGAGDKQSYSTVDGYKTYKGEIFQVPGVFSGPIAAGAGWPKATQTPDPRYTMRFEYKYDQKGRIYEESRFLNNGMLSSQSNYYYDAANRISGSRRFVQSSLRSIETTDYDKDGNISLEVEERAGERDETYRRVTRCSNYKLDFKKNWIERTETTTTTSRRALKEIVIRRIRTILYD